MYNNVTNEVNLEIENQNQGKEENEKYYLSRVIRQAFWLIFLGSFLAALAKRES